MEKQPVTSCVTETGKQKCDLGEGEKWLSMSDWEGLKCFTKGNLPKCLTLGPPSHNPLQNKLNIPA